MRERWQSAEDFERFAREFEQQSQTFAAFFSAVPDCLYTYDREERFAFANQALLDVWGLTEEEALGRTMADLEYPADVEATLLEGLRRVFRTGETVRSETCFTDRNGECRDYDNILAPVFNGDGIVVFVAGLSRDISERRRSQDALTRSEKKYRGLFAHLSAGFSLSEVVLDTQGQPIDYVYLEVNPAFEKLLGLRALDVVGKRATAIHPEIADDPADWISRLGRVATTGEPTHFEGHFEANGRWYSVTAYAPEPGHFATVFEDITRRKDSELELRGSEERYRAIAERLQAALLALPSELEGIDFAHAYHSATDNARVGGDFYDIFELNNGLLGITIGDVAGKGVEAAVLTSLVKNTIRAYAAEKTQMPRDIVSLTNETVYRTTPPEAFATVFFGILDRRDGRLIYANAGHCTAGCVKPDGSISKLPVTGPFLGASATASFEQAETTLEPDGLLFLYTDGLSEARHNGEFYGEERLFKILPPARRCKVLSNLIEEVVCDVLAFSDGQLHDDLAILAVRPRDHSYGTTPWQQKFEL